MKVTKELEKILKILDRYNKQQYSNTRVYNDKIFIHDGLIYSTDGRIFCYTENKTEQKDFSWFNKNKTVFSLEENKQKIKETKEGTKEGNILEKIIKNFDFFDCKYTLDFSGYDLPYSVMSGFKKRYNDRITIDFDKMEISIENNFFNSDYSLEEKDWASITYGDVLTVIDKDTKEDVISFPAWFLLLPLKQLKEKKVSIESNTQKKYNRFSIGDFHFIFMMDN